MASKRRRPKRRPTVTVTLPRVTLGTATKKPAAKTTRSNTIAVAKWSGRWTARGVKWAAPRVADPALRAVRSVGSPAAQRWAETRRNTAEYGYGHTLVRDHHTGALMEADSSYVRREFGPQPDDPDYDKAVDRGRRYQLAQVSHMLRDNPEALKLARKRYAPQPRTAPAAPAAAKPAPVPTPRLASVPSSKETVVSVADFADLSDPDIDQMEFAEQLPEFLTGAKDLFTKAAGPVGEMADYFSTVQGLDQDIVAKLNEAAEAYEAAVSLVGAARDRAQAVYGDFSMPVFKTG